MNNLTPVQASWRLNTSNPHKLEEFENLFSNYGFSLSATQKDLEEIESDPLTVIAHKVSQLDEGVLVDDTSLEIEGANVGTNIRWLVNELHYYIGQKAIWRVLLAYQKEGLVYVYEGITNGIIVSPRGDSSFGFDPIFLPEGNFYTLAEAKPDAVNARAKAVENLLKGTPIDVLPLITTWDGPWQ